MARLWSIKHYARNLRKYSKGEKPFMHPKPWDKEEWEGIAKVEGNERGIERKPCHDGWSCRERRGQKHAFSELQHGSGEK